MGDTSLGQLAFVSEATAGVTPATPAFKILDFTSETLEMSANQLRSDAVNASRVVRKSRRTSAEIGGAINFELYKGAEIDTLLAALLGNAFTGSPLRAKAGGSTLTSFTFERKLSSTDYRRYTGCRLNSLQLSISPEQYIQAVLSPIGYAMTTGATAISGSAYTAVTNAEKLTALDVASITLSNGLTGTFDFANLNMTISNNLTAKKRLGASATRGVTAGLATINGSMDLYCEDKTFADAFVAETAFDMDVALVYSAEGYTLEMRTVKITSYDDSNPGNGDSFIAKIGFECTLNSTYASSFGITKTS